MNAAWGDTSEANEISSSSAITLTVTARWERPSTSALMRALLVYTWPDWDVEGRQDRCVGVYAWPGIEAALHDAVVRISAFFLHFGAKVLFYA